MKINNLDFGQTLILAPMAGVSDVGFRALCSLFGADATYSEMLSARAMLHNPKKTAFMTESHDLEKIKIGQIFGHEPQVMASALNSPLLQKYDVIDINCGCPAPKIVKNGEGCALMKDLSLANQVISAVTNNCGRPVSVKFRLGFDKDNSLEFGRMCEEAGASFVTLHARTATQGYSGHADYEAIARLKAALHIPVIGNGDVINQKSYEEMLATGVDGVMIGRGAQGQPWIFSILKGGKKPENVYKYIEKHVEILRERYDESWLTLYMRKHFLWYTLGLEGGSALRAQIATSNSIDDSLKLMKQILK